MLGLTAPLHMCPPLSCHARVISTQSYLVQATLSQFWACCLLSLPSAPGNQPQPWAQAPFPSPKADRSLFPSSVRVTLLGLKSEPPFWQTWGPNSHPPRLSPLVTLHLALLPQPSPPEGRADAAPHDSLVPGPGKRLAGWPQPWLLV